jgi:spermidine synthase
VRANVDHLSRAVPKASAAKAFQGLAPAAGVIVMPIPAATTALPCYGAPVSVAPSANIVRTATIWSAAMLSGGAALAYEIAWSRALVVPLGNASDAAALVLAAFMIGIGAGAWVAGGWAERVRSPLRLYALAEVLLGSYALVAPHLLSVLSTLPGDTGAVFRPLLALLLIAAPCLAMGASLPLLVRALTRPGASMRRQVGIAYGANTAGAALGSLATGFWGLALVGTSRWSAFAAAGSFAAAILALLADRRRPSLALPTPDPSAKQETGNLALRRLALGATFVMGFVVLANEMLWARVLTFVFGHDTYAFATMLAVVLVGLSVGGAAHRLFASRDQAAWTAGLLSAFSLASLASFWVAAELVIRRGRDPFGLEASHAFAASAHLELLRELAYTPILVLLPCILAGAAFPAACSLHGHASGHVGQSIGRVTFANGVGSALGAVTASVAVGAVFGVQRTFFAVALASTAMAAVAILVSRPRSATTFAFAALPASAVTLMAIVMPTAMPRSMILASVGPRHQVFVHYEEARTGTVSVIENQINLERQLLMNGVNEVTTRLVHDQSFKALGHLAPLLHPNPKQGVMICLGAGISAGAALAHPLERLDVVDLSSAVQRGARHFATENHSVLDDPRFRLHIGDGRQFLLNTQIRYDVAIIDSTHPKAVDSWILYTLEFYELVHERLGEGGIAVQWLPLHGLSEREFKIIVHTFQGAFPRMTLWANVGFETYGQVGYAKLVGVRSDELVVDVPRVAERLRSTEAGKDLATWGMGSVEEILDLFVAGPDALAAWTDGLPVQTDDHPIIPYTTAFSKGRRMVPALLLGVREPIGHWLRPERSADPQGAIVRAAEGQGLVMAGQLARARELLPSSRKIQLFEHQTTTTRPYYEALAASYPEDPGKQFEAATQLAALGHGDRARPMYERALALRPGDFRARLDLAHLLLGAGDARESVELLAALRSDHPHSALVHYNLGAAVLASGDAGAAAAHLETALAYDGTLHGARVGLARARLALGELERAEREIQRVTKDNPWDGDGHHLLGLLRARQGRLEDAEQHLHRAQGLEPYRSDFLLDLGKVRVRRGDLAGAERAFRSLLRYHPTHARGMQELGEVLGATARWAEAAEMHAHALEADPGFLSAALGMARALRAEGRGDQAVDAYCLALRLDPDNEAALRGLKEMDAGCSE